MLGGEKYLYSCKIIKNKESTSHKFEIDKKHTFKQN